VSQWIYVNCADKRFIYNNAMRKLLFILLFALFISRTDGQLKICSWNLKDFGKSKSDEEISVIANILKEYDLLAIQEVVAGTGGPQAVARLAEELNRKGNKWDYTVSDPTSSSAYKQERYAFIWKTSRVTKKGESWLERKYNLEIDREPFYLTISYGGKQVTLVNFHAITKKMQPETEVKYFKFLPSLYPNKTLLFLGDFNLSESHTVFNPLKGMGYLPVLNNQKTSLKMKCKNGDCLASEFDNVFFKRQTIKLLRSGIVPFYKSYSSLAEARLISDHVPIYIEIELN
jgi:deoxyribonuclease-1-like protein